jgi:metal-sulfur cluster biosynthetic enzyme
VTPQVDDCAVDLVWKPAWDPMVHASEEVRMALGIW